MENGVVSNTFSPAGEREKPGGCNIFSCSRERNEEFGNIPLCRTEKRRGWPYFLLQERRQ
jgi:hypothetical protein